MQLSSVCVIVFNRFLLLLVALALLQIAGLNSQGAVLDGDIISGETLQACPSKHVLNNDGLDFGTTNRPGVAYSQGILLLCARVIGTITAVH